MNRIMIAAVCMLCLSCSALAEDGAPDSKADMIAVIPTIIRDSYMIDSKNKHFTAATLKKFALAWKKKVKATIYPAKIFHNR